MDTEESLSYAFTYLDSGKYKEAKEYFSQLLRESPQSIEYQAGFFSSGWWGNRQPFRKKLRQGRPLAYWLMQEWENFTLKMKEKGYDKSQFFQNYMQKILGIAADNFRLTFQEEGASSADPKLLQELALCLVQLGDYKNAIDILHYARTKKPYNPKLCFLLGEITCRTKEREAINRGLSYYREAFIIDPQICEPKWIASELASTILQRVYKENYKNQKDAISWFPAFLMAYSFSYKLFPLKNSSLAFLQSEAKRLLVAKEDTIEKYKLSVNSKLCFYLLAIIYEEQQKLEITKKEMDCESELRSLNKTLYDTFISKRNGRNFK